MRKSRPSDDGSFDREVADFSREREHYEKFAAYVCGLIGNYVDKTLIHTTEYRAKTVDSFDKKCRKIDEDGTLRYKRPLDEITDLAGVRVIVFLRDSVDRVCNSICDIFKVIEQEDVGDRVYKKGKFGYQSKHLLVKLADDRNVLFENKIIKNFVCEIQVRTLLQHAWAEMEHDIQYKSGIDVPLDLNKRFSALAGLLEIADREFASIQRDSEALKSAVREELLSDLTQQNFDKTLSTENILPGDSPLDARYLVGSGRYLDAIDLYTQKIHAEPKSYTLFIGRARARFLAGDARGAVADLDAAADLSIDAASATSRLRGIFEQGDDPRRALRALQAPNKFAADLQSANDAIKEGDGVRAFDDYSRLEANGYSRPYSLFGKAMACTLERDVEGARSFLASLEVRLGTPMSVNILALQCILDALDAAEPGMHDAELEKALLDTPQFDLDMSALSNLHTGMIQKDLVKDETIRRVFRRISYRGDEGGLVG